MINRSVEHAAQVAIIAAFTWAAYGLHTGFETEKSYAEKYPSLSGADLQKLKKADEQKAMVAGGTLGTVLALAYFPVGTLARRRKAEPKASHP